jgi:hypothetical protein
MTGGDASNYVVHVLKAISYSKVSYIICPIAFNRINSQIIGNITTNLEHTIIIIILCKKMYLVCFSLKDNIFS